MVKPGNCPWQLQLSSLDCFRSVTVSNRCAWQESLSELRITYTTVMTIFWIISIINIDLTGTLDLVWKLLFFSRPTLKTCYVSSNWRFFNCTFVCVCLSVCLVALLLCFLFCFYFTCLLCANKECNRERQRQRDMHALNSVTVTRLIFWPLAAVACRLEDILATSQIIIMVS